MHRKEADRSSKRRVAPPHAAPGGPPEPNPAQVEQIGRVEGAMERAAEATLRAAFDRFFDAWFDRVYAFAWQLGRDTSYAETLTTRLFMKALHLSPRSSKGAREPAHRLASERSRPATGQASGSGAARDSFSLRRSGRTS